MDTMINGIPLVAVVLGLVEFSKRLGVTGRGALATSLAIGLLLGGGYQISLGTPSDFAGWFGVAVYGLALGLTASGLYEFGVSLAHKSTARIE